MHGIAITEVVLSDGSYQMEVSKDGRAETRIVQGQELLELCKANVAGWPDVRCTIYHKLAAPLLEKVRVV